MNRDECTALLAYITKIDTRLTQRSPADLEVQVATWLDQLEDVPLLFARQQVVEYYAIERPQHVNPVLIHSAWTQSQLPVWPPAIEPHTREEWVPPWEQGDGPKPVGEPAYSDPEIKDWARRKIAVAIATAQHKPLPHGEPPLSDPYWATPPTPTFVTPIIQPPDHGAPCPAPFAQWCHCTHTECVPPGILNEPAADGSARWCPICWDGRNSWRLAYGGEPLPVGMVGPNVPVPPGWKTRTHAAGNGGTHGNTWGT